MYLLIKDTLNFIKIRIIIPLFLFILFFNNCFANDKFIGFIENLDGQVTKNLSGNSKRLNQFDQIFVNDIILVGPNSTLNISFIDNSILTLEGNSEFIVQEFNNWTDEKKFVIDILKGKFTFESGSIAKTKSDAMKINLGEVEVILNGTLVTGQNIDENRSIALVEDSMGKVGSLKVKIGDQTTTISESSSGLNIIAGNVQTTTLSNEETNQIKEKKKDLLVASSTQTEEEIERAMTKQLANGTIPDANGDGITDAEDIEAYKNDIFSLKGERFDYLVEYSSGANLDLMSDIIINSDPSQSMYLMQSMMDYDENNTTLIMDEVAKTGFDVFSHMALAEEMETTMPYMNENLDFDEVRSSIIEDMIVNQTEDSVDAIARVMAVSDPTMSTYLVEELTNFAPAGDENISIDVLASFTEMAPDKLTEFYDVDPEAINKFTTNAFQNADQDDIEMMATIMQETAPEDTALLMTNLVENKPEMIASVYNNLSEQDFDLFNHIESAKVKAGETVNVSIANDSMYGAEIQDGNQVFNLVVDEQVVAYQDEYFQNFKGEVFAEIIAHSEGTSSEIVADLMMDTTNGDTAMFMMESVMSENPDVLTEVMNNFADQNFDIFEHIEETTIEQEDEENLSENNDITLSEENQSVSEDGSIINQNAISLSENKIKLTKSERQALKEKKKAERQAAKIAKKEKRKAERQAAIAARKAANKAARKAAKQGIIEDETEILNQDIDNMKEFKSEVFREMIDNSNENTMTTMAKLVTTTDNSTASLIFETVISEQNDPVEDLNNRLNQNFALDLMNNLSFIESDIVDTIYDTQENLLEDVISTALSDVTNDDTEAIANIIASSENEELNELVFENIVFNNDDNLSSSVFETLADINPDAIMEIASMNQSLYENLAQDVSVDDITAASLLTSISYETDGSASSMSSAETSTYSTGGVTWIEFPMSMGPYTTSSYVSISSRASSLMGVEYSATDLPPGLSIDLTSGFIFGTPEIGGSWNTTITAFDIEDPTKFATASLFIEVNEEDDGTGNYGDGNETALVWMTMPNSPTSLTVDTSISTIYLYTSGGVGMITYSAPDLPSGLFITGSTISGVPDTENSIPRNVDIIARDENGNEAITSIYFPEITSNSGETLYWDPTPAAPSTLEVGTSMMAVYLYTNGGTGNITYSATGLPDGLFVSSSTIMGTPSTSSATESYVTIEAFDEIGNTATTTVMFPQVSDSSGGSDITWITTPAEITSTLGGSLTVDNEITSVSLDATGGEGSIFYYATGLPDGLSISGSTIMGTPTTENSSTSSVTITAEDDIGDTENLIVSFPPVSASSGGNVTWNTSQAEFSSLTLTEGTPMSSITLSATGVGIISYADDAMLPAGISLTAGIVSGTPTNSTETETSVTFTAQDQDGNTETLTVSFPIISASGSISNPTWISEPTFDSTYSINDSINITFDAASVPAANGIIYSATGLPSELSIDTESGLIYGMLTAADTYSVTIYAYDQTDNTYQISSSSSFVVSAGESVTWNTIPGDFPSTLTVNDPIATISLDATGTGTITYDYNGTLPPGLILTSGVLSGTPTTVSATETTIEFTATDENMDTADLVVTLPQVDAGGDSETVEFTTPSGLLATFNADDIINQTVTAEASQGSEITYTFSATNSENELGITGTNINVNDNIISGTAPRLFSAAAFDFNFTAEISNGATNSRTFVIEILSDSTCVSPTNNICT